MIVPINKYIAQDYRSTLTTSGAPQNIDSDVPITPVVVINQGLPKPNSKQILRYYTYRGNAAAGYVQVVTKNSNTRIYLVSVDAEQRTTGTNSTCTVFDAASGNIPTINVNTAGYLDELGDIFNFVTAVASTKHQKGETYPLPIEVKYGIRLYVDSNAADMLVTLKYIEEIIN